MKDMIEKFKISPRTPNIWDEQLNKKEWTIPQSIWASYRLDNEELLNKCYDKDWNDSKIANVIKDEKN